MTTTTTKLALHGGTPIRSADKPWPSWPQYDDTDREALLTVLNSGKWWYGEHVQRFEEAFATFQDAAHCVSCCNGTQAAEIAMRALGIGTGDEVIVPPYTFVSTAMSVAQIGAVPVFVDVDDTWCLDPNGIEAAITPRTKGIMPVHFGSSLADMDRINAIAKKHNLFVIEDACHSWGAKWNNKGTGALGDCGVFSFQQSKNLTASEGGAILTDDPKLAATCRSMINCGRAEGAAWFEHPVLGTNSRLTEFQGALLNSQLDKLAGQNALRAKNAGILNDALGAMDGITPQPILPQVTRRTYHVYGMRFDGNRFGCSRDQFLEAAQAEGLKISKGYPMPLYRQKFLDKVPGHDYSHYKCPVTEDLCDRSAVWMHQSVLLGTEGDMADIVAIFDKVRQNVDALNA